MHGKEWEARRRCRTQGEANAKHNANQGGNRIAGVKIKPNNKKKHRAPFFSFFFCTRLSLNDCIGVMSKSAVAGASSGRLCCVIQVSEVKTWQEVGRQQREWARRYLCCWRGHSLVTGSGFNWMRINMKLLSQGKEDKWKEMTGDCEIIFSCSNTIVILIQLFPKTLFCTFS